MSQLQATDLVSSAPHGRSRLLDAAPRGPASDGSQQERYDRQRLPLVMRLARKVRWPVNRFLVSQSLVGTAPFFEPSDIPGLRALSENWEIIRDEAAAVMADRARVPALGKVSPDHRGIAPTSAWKSFFFSGYGYHARSNRARCPKTAALLDGIPDLVVGFYSIFEPGTHVKAHKGVTSGLINVHLPLLVPCSGLGRCELRVEQDYRSWIPGGLLVFDETYEHEAWNETDEPRLVLLVQVLRPMRLPGRLMGRFFLWCIKRTSFVQDIRRNICAE